MGKDINYPSDQPQVREVGSLACRMCLVTHFTAFTNQPKKGKPSEREKKVKRQMQRRVTGNLNQVNLLDDLHLD